MNEKTDEEVDASDLAAERLAEIDKLSRRISARLSEMIDDLTDGTDPTAKEIASKLDQLHAAHLKVLTAEDAFHAKIGKDPDEGAVDYDAVRIEVGSRLNRLRDSLVTESVPRDAVTRPDGNAALPVRLLGDAASDPT